MKRTSLIASAILFAGAAGAAVSTATIQSSHASTRVATVATDIVSGVIDRVAPEDKEFDLRVTEDEALLDGEKVTIKVTDETSYTLDGEKSSMEEALKPRRRATVAHEDKVAVTVDVVTKKSPN